VAVDLLTRLRVWETVPEALLEDVRPVLTNVRGTSVGEIVAAVPFEARQEVPFEARQEAPFEARQGLPPGSAPGPRRA
jgi:hypothetical protein